MVAKRGESGRSTLLSFFCVPLYLFSLARSLPRSIFPGHMQCLFFDYCCWLAFLSFLLFIWPRLARPMYTVWFVRRYGPVFAYDFSPTSFSHSLFLSTYLFSAPLLYVYAENVSTINFTRIVVCAAIICNELYELYIVPISFTRIFLQITMKTIEQKIRFTKNDGRFSFTKMHPTHSTEL